MIKTILWSDLNPALKTDAQGNIKIDENIQAVLGSIDNILRTSKGERVMLPTFASDLRDVVFENMTSTIATLISDSIRDAINTWDDRVEVLKIDLMPLPDYNQIKITIQFNIKSYVSPVIYSGIY